MGYFWLLLFIFLFFSPSNAWAGDSIKAQRQQQVNRQRQAVHAKAQREVVEVMQQQAEEIKKEIQKRNEEILKMRAQQAGQKPLPTEEAIKDRSSQVLTTRKSAPAPSGLTTHVDESDFWQMLDRSSQAWQKIVDADDKVYVVSHFIEKYRQQGIKIRKSPENYAALIDDMARNGPEFLANPFERVLQVVAIIEYDFDNGQNKDELARKILGEQGYLANKKRLGF